MATLNITLPSDSTICNGKQVTFRAPCDCANVTAIQIDGVTYTLLNTADETVAGTNTFVEGALVSVIVDTENNKAYIQSSPGGANVVELTYDEYLALDYKDPDTLYVVTDQTVIADDIQYIKKDQLGVANGIATLDASGKVPSAQLPDYAPASHASDTVVHITAAERTAWNSKAPAYTYGTDDLTAGTSELATGTLHFVYE